MAGKSYSLEISFTVCQKYSIMMLDWCTWSNSQLNKELSRKSVFFYCILNVEKILIGMSVTLRCHDNEYGDLLTSFHFSSSETFFLQYAYKVRLISYISLYVLGFLNRQCLGVRYQISWLSVY